MKSMKVVAFLAFLLNTILFATYYAIAKEALGRIDPVMFTFFELMTLAPAGLCILMLTWRSIRWAVVKQGVLLGSSLCLALFTIAIALKYTTATGTAFFPALNGFLAALIAWVFLRQPVTKATWCAGLLSTIGVGLLIMNSSMGGIRGVLIAFLGGLFFTGYVFLSDNPHDQHDSYEHGDQQAHWPLFGIELLTMALWACLVALLFGDWGAIHMALPRDGMVVLYVAGACTFLPTLITELMQKYISPVTVSFIYILEPVFSAIIAMLYLHEMLSLNGYIGGVLVVAGALIHTRGVAWKTRHPEHIQRTYAQPVGAPVQETQKLLGVRLSPPVEMGMMAGVGAGLRNPGPSGSPVFRITEPLEGRFPARARATQRVPSPPQRHPRPYGNDRTHNRRGVYSMGAVEWVDEDVCEQPTRPELLPDSSSSARERAVWMGADVSDVYSQPTESFPIVRQTRVRITDELKESPAMTLQRSSSSDTGRLKSGEEGVMNVAPTGGGKGAVWLEEDASIFPQSRKELLIGFAEFAD